MLKDGQPNADLFTKDLLHMNEKGYAIWTGILKPLLEGGKLAPAVPATSEKPSKTPGTDERCAGCSRCKKFGKLAGSAERATCAGIAREHSGTAWSR